MSDNQILFVAGLGATGSSAVIDLLKEVKSFFVFENEFRLFVDPGGLINLRDAIVENWSIFQTDIAIKNFQKIVNSLNCRFRSPYSTLDHSKYLDDHFVRESEKYVQELLELEYAGLWYGIDHLIKRQLNKLRLFYRNRFTSHPIYVAKQLTDGQFNEITDRYIRSLISYCLNKYNAKHFCFNENFSCLFPEKILSMVPGSKMLLVIRDPRDVFATAIDNKWPAAPENGQDFLKWEYSIFTRWMDIHDRLLQTHNDKYQFKVIRFEDLILHYTETVADIFEFLQVNPEDHINKEVYLKPSVSKKNVGLWRSVLTADQADSIFTKFEAFYEKYRYIDP